MIVVPSPPETSDTKLACIYNEISALQANCSDFKNTNASDELKQRMYFLQWMQESLTVVYGVKKKQL